MKVRFYSFSKRNKSTKQVASNTPYRELDLKLKDGCSMLRPVFLLQTVDPSAYNYFYVVPWDRYYFIANVDFYEGMYEVGGAVDPLASFKSEIGSTEALILYASGASNNLPDTRIPVKANVSVSSQSAAFPWQITSSPLTAIVGITGKGSFGPYLLGRSDVRELLDGVDGFTSNWQDTKDALKQLFFGGSAGECLRSAIMLPMVVTGDIDGTFEDIYLGAYPCKDSGGNQIRGIRINKPVIKKSVSVAIPWINTDWRAISAYTDIALYIPFIGILSMPASELHSSDSSLAVTVALNVTSGDIAVEVRGESSGRIYATSSGNCALNTPYGSTGIDTNRATAAVVSGIGTIVSIGVAGGTAMAGAAVSASTASAIGSGIAATSLNTLAAVGGHASGSGGLGGGAGSELTTSIKCFVITKQLSDSADNLDPIIGKPLSKKATPSSYSGYVQTDGFQFASNRALSEEKDLINSMLDSGIYYE